MHRALEGEDPVLFSSKSSLLNTMQEEQGPGLGDLGFQAPDFWWPPLSVVPKPTWL
jgi:hypothetical protein